MQPQPFQPAAASVTLAVLATSAQLTLASTLSGLSQVRLANIGDEVIYFEFGTNPTAAVATSTPMLPNTVEVFNVPAGATKVAAIAAGTGNNLIATQGSGT